MNDLNLDPVATGKHRCLDVLPSVYIILFCICLELTVLSTFLVTFTLRVSLKCEAGLVLVNASGQTNFRVFSVIFQHVGC